MALTPDEIYNQTRALSQARVLGYIFHHVLSSRLIASLYNKTLQSQPPAKPTPGLWCCMSLWNQKY